MRLESPHPISYRKTERLYDVDPGKGDRQKLVGIKMSRTEQSLMYQTATEMSGRVSAMKETNC